MGAAVRPVRPLTAFTHGPDDLIQSGDDPAIDSLKQALAERNILVQEVREELIRAQITILELQDTVLQKETDKADAVAILGQAELILESKINYIFELVGITPDVTLWSGARHANLNARVASVMERFEDFCVMVHPSTQHIRAGKAWPSLLFAKCRKFNRLRDNGALS